MAFAAALPAVFSSFAGGLGTLVSAGGAIMGALSANQQAKYQAAVAENNAKIAVDNANRNTTATQEKIVQSDNELAALVGDQLSTQGASGLSVSGRTQFLTRKGTKEIGRQDSLNIAKQGETESRNFLQQSADFRSEAGQARTAGKNALISGGLGAIGSLAGSSKSFSSSTAQRFKNDPWNPKGGPNMRVRTV